MSLSDRFRRGSMVDGWGIDEETSRVIPLPSASAVFDDTAFLVRCAEVEAALARAQARVGIVPPEAAAAISAAAETVKADPNICIVRTPGAGNLVEHACGKAGISVDVFQFAGDYYSLPNLVPLLSKPSKLELLMEILDYPLPARKSA